MSGCVGETDGTAGLGTGVKSKKERLPAKVVKLDCSSTALQISINQKHPGSLKRNNCMRSFSVQALLGLIAV